ncbi:MAG TPA: hypothetical protein VNH18_16470, partial [Bryobacteraceae bacterium]|nr:hypothetical protein [Bryobacteraceae bacterium]
TAPGIFTRDTSGAGRAVLLNADGSVNTSDDAVAPGSVISTVVNGAGATSPPDLSGGIVRTAAPVAATVSATVDGETAEVIGAGSIVGQIAGLARVDVRLPQKMSDKSSTLVLTIGGKATSPQVVTVAIGPKP